MKTLLLAFTYIALLDQVYTKCPSPTLIKPCECFDYVEFEQLDCSFIKTTDIKGVFQNISKALDEKDRQFVTLKLFDIYATELPAHTFADLKFNYVLISASKIKHINTHALNGTADTVMYLEFMGMNLTDNADIFNVVNTLDKLETLSIGNCNLKTIPENVIKDHKKLTSLKISSEKLAKISGNAFRALGSSLRYMEISSANITAISDNAFAFDDSLKTNLRLVLDNNIIDMSGVSKSAFKGAKRPVSLVLLNDNTIAYLDESTFGTFMTENPLNEVITQINCNECRNAWLKKPEFKSHVNGIYCTNGLDLNDENNFPGC